MTLRSPSFHKLIAGHDTVVLDAYVGPNAFLPQRVVEINKNERLVRLGISEAEHAASHSRGHLCLHPVILQHNTVISRSGFLFFM